MVKPKKLVSHSRCRFKRKLPVLFKRRSRLYMETFWDGENNEVPREGSSVSQVYHNIRRACYRRRCLLGSLHFYAAKSAEFLKPTIDELREIPGADIKIHQVELLHDPCLRPGDEKEKRDVADLEMNEDILHYALVHEQPAPMFIITSDKDFLTTIIELRKFGYSVDVSYQSGQTGFGMKTVTNSQEWRKLTLDRSTGDDTPMLTARGRLPPIYNLLPQPRLEISSYKVFWDPRSAPFPGPVKEMREKIRRFLRRMGLGCGVEGNIVAFARDHVIPKHSLKVMKANGIDIEVVFPPTKEKKRCEGHVDAKLSEAIHKWLINHKNSFPVLLISSDLRLTSTLTKLVRDGYHVTLCHGKKAPRDLINAASDRIPLDDLDDTDGDDDTDDDGHSSRVNA